MCKLLHCRIFLRQNCLGIQVVKTTTLNKYSVQYIVLLYFTHYNLCVCVNGSMRLYIE